MKQSTHLVVKLWVPVTRCLSLSLAEVTSWCGTRSTETRLAYQYLVRVVYCARY